MNIITVIAIVLAISFLIWQLIPFIKAREMQGVLSPDLSDVLNEGQAKAKRLLIYFWSPSCGMCRSVTPVIDKLMQSRDDVLKINVSENLDVARRFKIMGTPTMVLINEGKIDKVIIGAKSEKSINTLLNA